MTFVLGANCMDGVVLISDRKVTNAPEGEEYQPKIKALKNFNNLVFTAAGIQSLFEEFLEELPRRVIRSVNWIAAQNQQLPEGLQYQYEVYNFKQECVKLLNEMYAVYENSEIPQDETALQVLFVINEVYDNTTRPRLYYLDWGTRYAIPVSDRMAIGDAVTGEIFLKSYKKDCTMKDAARLGAFIIKYIEQEKLSDGIGIGEFLPQIYFCPADASQGSFRELNEQETKGLLDGVDDKVAELRHIFGMNSRFLRN